ncbi:rRNA-processing protein sof1, partial [Linnemannia gamsii]
SRIAVADQNCRLELYDPQTGDILKGIRLGYHVKPRSLAFSPNGRQIAIGTENGSIQLWNHEAEEEPSVRLQGHNHWVLCMAYSSCGQWLASGSSGQTVRIWRRCQQQQLPEGAGGVESWSCETVVGSFFASVQRVSWNTYGPLEFVTRSWDKSVRIWRISVAGDIDDGGGKGGVTVNMIWGSNIGRLCVEGLRFEGATGLDPVYEKLLLQRGAIDASVGATAADEVAIAGDISE